jgi:ABC-2 type transport system permease protein
VLPLAAGHERARDPLARILAVMHRHFIVLKRSPHRWFEISFWPTMDVVLWGSLGVFVASQSPDNRASTPYLLGGITLFWTFTQAQFSIALGVNEETWTRNILNVFTTPITELDYLIGVALFGLLKLALCLAALTVATGLLFSFSLATVGWAAVPIIVLLVVNGWALGLIGVGLVLRFGQSAEILIWGVNYMLLAFSGVVFPTDAMPRGLGAVAGALPTTRLFAALRRVLDGNGIDWGSFGLAAIASFVFLALAALFANRLLGVFRHRGFVTRYS